MSSVSQHAQRSSSSVPALPPVDEERGDVADQLTDTDESDDNEHGAFYDHADHSASSQRSVLIAQLRERRNLLRARAEMLLKQMPATPPAPRSIVSSPLNPHVHVSDVHVLAVELERCAWNPVMELANLVFAICSRSWDAEHQERSARVCSFYASRDGGRREKAWTALISSSMIDSPFDANTHTADSGMIHTSRSLRSSPPRAHSAATALWEAALVDEQRRLRIRSNPHQTHTSLPAESSNQWSVTPFRAVHHRGINDDGISSDEDDGGAAELEALVALKYAENCTARRPLQHLPPPTRLSSLLQ
jgi:hypothetical protein